MSQQVIAPAAPQRAGMIKGLFPSLPERGKIKIGQKGAVVTSSKNKEFQPPQKLDHFLVTTLDRGQDGNFLRDEEIHATLGEAPTDIPIRLLYDDPTVNFPTRYACYVGRSLWCAGDGETAMRAGADGIPKPIACPCPRKEPGYAKSDKCKMNGVLSVLIDGAGGLGGVWKFRTTSYNSIVGILSSMAFLRSVTGGVLANIPLRMIVRPKRAQAPDGTPALIYVVGIEFAGDMAALQDAAHGIALARATTHVRIADIEAEARRLLLAPPNAPLPGDNDGDVVEEFYPEQAEAALAKDAVSYDLDAFAPAAEDAPVSSDAEAIAFLALVADKAAEGTEAFRAYWKSLSKANRDFAEAHCDMTKLKAVADDADRRAAETAYPFEQDQPRADRPVEHTPQAETPAPPAATLRQQNAPEPASSTATWPAGEPDDAERAEFWSGERYEVNAVRIGGRVDASKIAMAVIYWIEDARSEAEIDKLLADSERVLNMVKLAARARWQEIMDRADARRAELAAP